MTANPAAAMGLHTKALPPTPLLDRDKSHDRAASYSAETYANLLEQENEQLRKRTQQLQLQVKSLETKVKAERTRRKANKEIQEHQGDELKRRDRIVGDIAETIINEFRRYKEMTEKSDREEITVFSQFDSNSPV